MRCGVFPTFLISNVAWRDEMFPRLSCYFSRKQIRCIFTEQKENLCKSFSEVIRRRKNADGRTKLARSVREISQLNFVSESYTLERKLPCLSIEIIDSAVSPNDENSHEGNMLIYRRNFENASAPTTWRCSSIVAKFPSQRITLAIQRKATLTSFIFQFFA